MGLSARNSFWSVLDPTKLTDYTCTTRLVAPNRRSEEVPPLVIDHSLTNAAQAGDLLKDFSTKVQAQLDAVAPKPTYGDIIPPEAVGELWPGLDLDLLHREHDRSPQARKHHPSHKPRS